MKWTITPGDAELIWDALLRKANEVERVAAEPAVVRGGLRALLLDDTQHLRELAARFQPPQFNPATKCLNCGRLLLDHVEAPGSATTDCPTGGEFNPEEAW